MKYLILFERDLNDEVLPNPASATQRFEQLEREMEGLLPLRFISLTRTAYPQDMILCEVESDLDPVPLSEWMQAKLYDDLGASGFYSIVATISGTVERPITLEALDASPCFSYLRSEDDA